MIKNILQLLELNRNKNPNKDIFASKDSNISYDDFTNNSKKLGTNIFKKIKNTNMPIAIFIDKGIECLVAMMGVVYSGNFYTIIDTKTPKERAKLIYDKLEPEIIIADSKNYDKLKEMNISENIILYNDLLVDDVDENIIKSIRNKMIDTDLMYVLFTSGSTGEPKGTAVSHRSVITYISFIVETFDINEKTIFGNQTPFYFSMSVLDIFSTIAAGATLYIIPKIYFSFPVKLIEYLNENKINTIYWVPSALCIVANLKILDEIIPITLNKILFAGEVMPVKQLNEWREKVDAMYVNLYGPTEITDICTYYILDRNFKENESIPIGYPCNNCDILILKEDGQRAKKGEKGELCVRGSFLAMGYYNDKEKTEKAFVQNPLNKNYPEKIYKTGDIVKLNENNEIIYICRKDSQIKHMGYRIELGEIERNVNGVPDIQIGICIYDEKASKIILFYQSKTLDEKSVYSKLKEILLPYMIPNEIIKLSIIPYNQNGKIDRKRLKKDYLEGKYKWKN